MAKIVSLVDDLMLASRVRASLEAAGHEVSEAHEHGAETLIGGDLIVADLEVTPPEELASTPVPVLGFYSHVDTEMKRRADAAGLAMAVPRSRMARELPQLVDSLLG